MRPTDLDASWIAETGRSGMGVTFECPVHRGGGCYQGVWFKNPIDGGPPRVDTYVRKSDGATVPINLWQRTGDTLETLTLSPSVDASANSYEGTPCWHGHITNGRIE